LTAKAEPFILQTDRFAPEVIELVQSKGLLVALEGAYSLWSFVFGKTWAKKGGIPAGFGDRFTCLTLGKFLSNGEQEIFAGSYKSTGDAYAFRSVDSGRSWQPLRLVYPGTGGHESTTVYDIMYKNGNIFLTQNGIASI